MLASIFLEFNLPNATTWFYFSLLLVMALFFRFDRFLSLRNWDLLTLFFMAPGFLLLQEAHLLQYTVYQNDLNELAKDRLQMRATLLLHMGYIWLIAGSGYWFIRSFVDLALIRRPTMMPNLNKAGLACFTTVLLVSMTAVAIRRMPDVPPEQISKGSIMLTRIQEGATAVVNYQSANPELSKVDAQFWVEKSIVMLLHLAIIIGLVLIGTVHFQDTSSGFSMACLYLLVPYTALNISKEHHVLPAVFLVWAIFAYRKPIIAGSLLGLAAGSIFFPLLLFPLWFGFYRGRGAISFGIAFLAITLASLAITAMVLSSRGEFSNHLNIALSLSDWQAWKKPQTESIWTGSHWAYRIPVFVVYMTFVSLTIFWPTPRNLGQVVAQTAAVVIGVQFWYADQGGVYVLWYLPLLLVLVFRPNLTERRPPPIHYDSDWLWRSFRAIARMAQRVTRRTTRTTNQMAPQ